MGAQHTVTGGCAARDDSVWFVHAVAHDGLVTLTIKSYKHGNFLGHVRADVITAETVDALETMVSAHYHGTQRGVAEDLVQWVHTHGMAYVNQVNNTGRYIIQEDDALPHRRAVPRHQGHFRRIARGDLRPT
jgi:hypothetical protein